MSLEEVVSLSSGSSSSPGKSPFSPDLDGSNAESKRNDDGIAVDVGSDLDVGCTAEAHYTLLITCLNESKLFNVRIQRHQNVLIGRGREWTTDPAADEFVSDIRIPDGEISSKHCTIGKAVKSGIFVQDLSSLNGTSLNAEPLPASTRHTLSINDEISIGKTIIKLIPCVCSACDAPLIVDSPTKSSLKSSSRVIANPSNSPVETCMICGISLTSFALSRRQRHINDCCSRSLGDTSGHADLIDQPSSSSTFVNEQERSRSGSPSFMPEKKKKKKRGRKKGKGVRCEGSVEEVEDRIREIDGDIASLQAHRSVLLKHLEKLKSLQQHKQTAVNSQEETHAKSASSTTLTNALFHNSQDSQSHRQPKVLPSPSQPKPLHTLLPISDAKQTPLWTLTGTCQVEEDHIPGIAADDSFSPQNDQNQANLTVDVDVDLSVNVSVGKDSSQVQAQPARAKTVTDGDIVHALTKAKRNEKLYHNILIGNVVELETIQHAVAVVTEKRVPMARLVRFLDKQGITYKQY